MLRMYEKILIAQSLRSIVLEMLRKGFRGQRKRETKSLNLYKKLEKK